MAAVMGLEPPNEKQSKGVARRRRLQHQRSNANHMLWYMRQLQAGAAHHTSQRTGHDAVAMAANLEALLAAGKDLLVLMDAKLNTFKATCNSDMTRATKNPAEEENEAPLKATNAETQKSDVTEGNAETQKSDVIEGYVAVESDFVGASAQMGADDNKDTVEVTEQQATEPEADAGDPATELAHCAARAPHLVGAVASSSVDGGVVAGEKGAFDDAETLAADGEDGVEQHMHTSEADEDSDTDGNSSIEPMARLQAARAEVDETANQIIQLMEEIKDQQAAFPPAAILVGRLQRQLTELEDQHLRQMAVMMSIEDELEATTDPPG